MSTHHDQHGGQEEILRAILGQLTEINHKLHHLEKLEKKMSVLDDNIAELRTEVANNTTIAKSAVALLKGIPALIDAAVQKALAAGATEEELAALKDLSTSLKQNDTDLAAAIAENTPQA